MSGVVGGLFLGGMFAKWPTNAALFVPAIVWEMVIALVTNAPWQDRFLHGQYRKAPDPDHLIERLEGFFIIIVGEGVFLLIKNSPLGLSIGGVHSNGIMVLIIYYNLLTFYFNNDQSLYYIQAIRRSWWSATIYISTHVWMYGSILTADASFNYLITHEDGHSEAAVPTEPSTAESSNPASAESSAPRPDSIQGAKWVVSISLTIALLCMTIISLLHKSLDRSGSLVINNRYARLAPRVASAIIIACIPIRESLPIGAFIGIIMGLFVTANYLEYGFGMEKGPRLLEPKRGYDYASSRLASR